MLTLVIFLMGNNSNLADMGGEGGQKSENLADIICERPLCKLSLAPVGYKLERYLNVHYVRRRSDILRPHVHKSTMRT